jgi:hypothetical protein
MEIWKNIDLIKHYAEYHDYEVSNYGRIRNKRTGKIRKTFEHNYELIALKNHNISIHRVVAYLFVENPLNKPEVNHIDGNKFNNHHTNLEWVTRKENVQHGLYVLGKNSNTQKQREAARKNIKIAHEKGLNRLSSIKVICIETNKIFDRKIDACNEHNISIYKINESIHKGRKYNGFSFKHYEST